MLSHGQKRNPRYRIIADQGTWAHCRMIQQVLHELKVIGARDSEFEELVLLKKRIVPSVKSAQAARWAFARPVELTVFLQFGLDLHHQLELFLVAVALFIWMGLPPCINGES